MSEPEKEQEEQIEQEVQVKTREQELEEEVQSLKDQLLRALAETENIRKRSEKSTEEALKYAATSFAKDIINVLENLYRAEESITGEDFGDNQKLKGFIEGVAITKRECVQVFERHGIKRVYPMGEKFDHNYHQAIAQIPDENQEPGIVIQVLQAGYTLKDRLLRPALVGVTTKPEEKS